MKVKRLDVALPEKNFGIVLETGDDVMASLLSFAQVANVTAARFTAIGGFSRVVLGHFDMEKRDYLKIPVEEQIEVVSLIGDIALENGKPKIHAHVVVGKRDGTAAAGHLIEATVRPTLEIMLGKSPSYLKKESDPENGLALIQIPPSEDQFEIEAT